MYSFRSRLLASELMIVSGRSRLVPTHFSYSRSSKFASNGGLHFLKHGPGENASRHQRLAEQLDR